jgi:hypothetical protein
MVQHRGQGQCSMGQGHTDGPREQRQGQKLSAKAKLQVAITYLMVCCAGMDEGEGKCVGMWARA